MPRGIRDTFSQDDKNISHSSNTRSLNVPIVFVQLLEHNTFKSDRKVGGLWRGEGAKKHFNSPVVADKTARRLFSFVCSNRHYRNCSSKIFGALTTCVRFLMTDSAAALRGVPPRANRHETRCRGLRFEFPRFVFHENFFFDPTPSRWYTLLKK